MRAHATSAYGFQIITLATLTKKVITWLVSSRGQWLWLDIAFWILPCLC